MCGITGILRLDGKPASRDVLERMNARIVHRGPDEDGLQIHQNVGLAMRRLSIIDRACGNQPLSNEDGTVWIVFNGEIYNFPELVHNSKAGVTRFAPNVDTEAIVHAYEEWGHDCPKHLRGMFAFAIYDRKYKELFLARDRVGKKPLLYTTARNTFAFASEFSALLAHPDVQREPNRETFDEFLSTACIAAPRTGFKDIWKLPPAHWLSLRNGEITIEPYWSLEPHFAPERRLKIGRDEAAQELLRRLEEAVRIRLMSEVPLGAFLSGGVDSSAVVALMSRLSSERVKTFSVGFEESEYSEVHHARRLAERYNTDHTEIIVKPDAAAILPTLVRHFGEPYADSSAVPTYYVSQATRKHVTVALNGDGGDEVFGGYERYRAMQIAESVPLPCAAGGGASCALHTGQHQLPFALDAIETLVAKRRRAASSPLSQLDERLEHRAKTRFVHARIQKRLELRTPASPD
jgi:asparagine synthase (glutamine-hydrolysing)